MAPKNPPEEQSQTNKSSVYLQDAEELKAVFEKFDANGDGRISSSELTDILHSMGTSVSDDEIRRAMSDLDTDKDGFISFEEFAVFCRSTAPTDSTHGGNTELRDAFELYDQNKNGLICASELHQALTRLKIPCSLQDCEKMIKSVDKDGDGHVNFEEFKSMMNGTLKPRGG